MKTNSLALKAQFGALAVFVCTILLGAGCGHYHASEFVAVHRPVKFENWRLYVNVSAPTADISGTNRWYEVSTVAWTLPGDMYCGDTNAFLPTAYDASLDSLLLLRIEGTNVADLPLPPLRHGSSEQPNRMVQLFHADGTGVEVPASVRELRKVPML
jgi:hypothetical protein